MSASDKSKVVLGLWEMAFDEAVDKIKQHSRNFAKRQLTWLRSLENLVWLDGETPLQENINIIKKHLN